MNRSTERYHQLRAAGLCTHCGKQPPLPQEHLCAHCKDYFAQIRANRTAEQRERRRETHRRWQKAHPENIVERGLRYRAKLRAEVLQHYGGVCVCCGEAEQAFLTIDHVDGGGNAARRLLFNGHNRAGHVFYRKLRRHGYPPGFQVLCWNCHMAITHFGTCPHALADHNAARVLRKRARAAVRQPNEGNAPKVSDTLMGVAPETSPPALAVGS